MSVKRISGHILSGVLDGKLTKEETEKFCRDKIMRGKPQKVWALLFQSVNTNSLRTF